MKNMDDILNQALTPENEPDYWLIQNILSQSKEATPMKKTTRKKYVTAVLSCLLALGITSISVYAAWRYLKPDEIVQEMGLEELADAFSGENAVYINETQSFGGYDVTLLGITSGKNLTSYKYLTDNGKVLEDRSYILIAVEGENATSVSHEDFNIVPIITGYDAEPCLDISSVSGSGGRFFTENDVLYYMHECNNLEKFADHAIYLCVSDDLPSFSEYSYLYDSASGTIRRNEEYEGLNALFSLPIDPAKADPKAAQEAVDAYQEYQKELERQQKQLEEHPELNYFPSKVQEAFDFVEQITPENIDELATPLTGEGAVYTFVPDSQGRLNVRYSCNGLESRSKPALKDLFPDGQTKYVSYTGISNDNPDSMALELYTLQEDGSVTLQLYVPNFPE